MTSETSSGGQTFTYRALRPDGSEQHGSILASDRGDAIARLLSRGLHPLTVEHAVSRATIGRVGRSRLSLTDAAIGLRMLATLLDSGLPLGRALWIYADVAPHSWVSALPALKQAVREGQRLSDALSSALTSLPPVLVGIIRAGESTGDLPRAVRRAAAVAERDEATRSALRAALVYPLLLLIIGSGAVAVLVTVVIPRFAAVLTELNQVLPTSTLLVLNMTAAVRALTVPLIASAILFGLLWWRWRSTPAGRLQWDGFLLAVPIFGRIRHAAVSARVCSAVAELLESGLPLPAALLHGGAAAGNAAVATRLGEARQHILAGSRLAVALEHTRALPAITIKLIQSGEDSGMLSHMLVQAARLAATQAETATKGFVRVLEPLLLLLFGGLVALVAAALLQAVYAVRPSVS